MVPPFAATTDDITVTVRPVYLDEPSDLFSRRFVFAYRIDISNDGPDVVQLLRRRWLIREHTGREHTVEGEGVIGQQPVIPPGESHSYGSSCLLAELQGTMEGAYLMQREGGGRFHVAIPRFALTARGN